MGQLQVQTISMLWHMISQEQSVNAEFRARFSLPAANPVLAPPNPAPQTNPPLPHDLLMRSTIPTTHPHPSLVHPTLPTSHLAHSHTHHTSQGGHPQHPQHP